MAVTETTTESWTSRLGGAVKGVVAGLALFILGFPVLFWNEGNSVKTAKALDEGEGAYATVNCGWCQNKQIEVEDNYFELTRKFSINETVSFKGEKLEHPKIKEEATILQELGHFVLTNKRIIYLSQKNAVAINISDIKSADFDDINLVTFHHKDGNDILIKFPDEAAGVMHILFNRIKNKQF